MSLVSTTFPHYPAVIRSGTVAVRKAGISLSSWKGWRQRWLVLKAKTLIAYKESGGSEISLWIPLQTLKRLEYRSPRGLFLVTGSATQYHLSFQSINDLEEWYNDICEWSPLISVKVPEPSSSIEMPLGDEDAVVERIIGEYAESPSSEYTASSEAFIYDGHIPWSVIVEPSYSQYSRSEVENQACELSTNFHSSESSELIHVGIASQPIPKLVLEAEQRDVIRKAISLLCHSMEPRLLRTSDPSGAKSFDLIDLRLRPLLQLKRKWKKLEKPDELDEQECRAFSQALMDGYVLCQLINTLLSSPIIRPDIRDTVNVAKFRAQCKDVGLSEIDIFLPKDIEEASGESLTRVAQTIVVLVKTVGDSTSRTAIRNALIQGEPSRTKHKKERSCVEDWVERFITSRLDKRTLRFDPTGEFAPTSAIHRLGLEVDEDCKQSSQTPKVYQNLFTFVAEMAGSKQSSQSASLGRALNNLFRFMASLDDLSSLIESRQYRRRLLQISAELKLKSSDNKRLRDALRQDDEHIAGLLSTAVQSDGYQKIVLALQGEDAQSCVDLIQDVLDKASTSEQEQDASDVFKHKAQRLLVKISEAQDILPRTLFIKGVKRVDKEACCGGTFGDIYRGKYKDKDVALKRVRVFQDTLDRHKIIRGLCREALLWRTLQHPYVLSFAGIDSESFDSLLCMVSPWMKNGTILKYLRGNGLKDVELKLFEIAQGLAYLHSQHIIHGDLRGSNVFVDDDWHACLADFGLAVFSDATVGTNSSHNAGSVKFMSPELHHPQSFGLKYFRRTFASDVYSFGCICIELYTGKPPFADMPDPAALLQVMAGNRPSRPVNGVAEMPDYLWDLVQLCWSHNRAERPSMSKVVELMQGGSSLELVPYLPSSPEAFDMDITFHGLALSGKKGLVRGKGVRRTKGSRSF